MKKQFTLFTLLIVFVTASFGQEAAPAAPADTAKKQSNWKCTGIIGLNFSQTALVNWAAGGNNNFNGVAFANVFLKYKKGKMAWETNLDTDFGIMYTDNSKYDLRKSNDKLNFSTKFGYEFAKNWYLTAQGSFKSQYAPGHEYTTENGEEKQSYISNILSPGYSDLSIGIDWKPNTIFSLYLSPVAGRITVAIDSNLRARYGVDLDKTNKAELGMTFKAGVNYTLIKNLKILSTLTLFTPYTKKFGNIDVDWDFMISYQFLKVLNVTLTTSLKYYDRVMITLKDGGHGPRVQFKEVLGLGIGYSF